MRVLIHIYLELFSPPFFNSYRILRNDSIEMVAGDCHAAPRSGTATLQSR